MQFYRKWWGSLFTHTCTDFSLFTLHTIHLYLYTSPKSHIGRVLDHNTRGTHTTSTLVNCRNKLNPPLPKTYFGHATFPTVTQTCSFDEVVHNPLSYAVGKVKEAIGKVNDEYVRSALDYIANENDMNLLRDAFYYFEGRDYEGGEFRGINNNNPNLFVLGWTNFPFFETDFGWGKPDYMVPGNINCDGEAILLNAPSGDGFVVVIGLQRSHVDAMKKLFYEEIEPIASKL